MKKIVITTLFAFAAIAFVNKAEAQVKVNVNINIGDQPQWGPAGYDYAEYYYLPDIKTYYYVPQHQFVYFSGNRWVFANALPPMYANYNLYNGYKVVLRSRDAYKHFDEHRVKYGRYKNYGGRQLVIRDRHDNGNYYGEYKQHGKGNGNGHGRGRGHGGKKH